MPATDAATFIAAMQPVAIELLGEPNKALSSARELRFGTRGSVAVDLRAGTWFDHEAGAGGGVLDLLRERQRLDKPEALQWLHERGHLDARAPKKPNGSGTARTIKAVYPYHDASGALLFEVVRFEPKDFRQRRPDGNGGHIWDLKGIEPVPYRLPELLAAQRHALVFIVEGEKDVDALRERDLIATCNPGGAGKWPTSFARHFMGRKVVVLPDNDDAGRSHATKVWAALAGHAESVGMLALPGPPAKGDVSDWLASGGTADELERLAREALATDEAQPDEAALAVRDFLSIEAWTAREMPPPDRLLGSLLTTTSRVFLVGAPGSARRCWEWRWHAAWHWAPASCIGDRVARRGCSTWTARCRAS